MAWQCTYFSGVETLAFFPRVQPLGRRWSDCRVCAVPICTRQFPPIFPSRPFHPLLTLAARNFLPAVLTSEFVVLRSARLSDNLSAVAAVVSHFCRPRSSLPRSPFSLAIPSFVPQKDSIPTKKASVGFGGFCYFARRIMANIRFAFEAAEAAALVRVRVRRSTTRRSTRTQRTHARSTWSLISPPPPQPL